jgi:hypothetical protein
MMLCWKYFFFVFCFCFLFLNMHPSGSEIEGFSAACDTKRRLCCGS